MIRKFRYSLILLAALTAGSMPAAKADIRWNGSYQSGLSQARAANKPIIIDFYADWCPPCREMERSTWPDGSIKALSTKFVMVKLNVDVAQREAAAYNIRSIPTTVFLDSQGRFLGQLVGGIGPRDLASAMRQVLAKTKSSPAPKVAAQPKRPDNVRVMQGGEVKQGPTDASSWQKLPGMTDITSQKGYAGVYLLDENGAKPLDAPKPKAKPKAKTTAASKKPASR